jgi:putative Mg2+ transporter-C (MgtC) family protein
MISYEEIILRLLLGTLIGGVIGFERQIHGRPAGLRTHLLVCVASVLLMIVSEYYHYLGVMDSSYVRADPGRIAAGAITGVGFIGAGVVLKTGFSIQGLTTAACIWVVSAIGLSVGSGLYVAGIATFFITISSLTLLRLAERKMPKLAFSYITVSADSALREEDVLSLIDKSGLSVSNIDYEKCSDSQITTLTITVSFYKREALAAFQNTIFSLPQVKRVCIKS